MLLNLGQYSAIVDLLNGCIYITEELCLVFYDECDSNAKKRLTRLQAQFIIHDGCLKSLPSYKIVLPFGAHQHTLYIRYFQDGVIPLTKSWTDFKLFYETKKSKCGLLRCDFDNLYAELCMYE